MILLVNKSILTILFKCLLLRELIPQPDNLITELFKHVNNMMQYLCINLNFVFQSRFFFNQLLKIDGSFYYHDNCINNDSFFPPYIHCKWKFQGRGPCMIFSTSIRSMQICFWPISDKVNMVCTHEIKNKWPEIALDKNVMISEPYSGNVLSTLPCIFHKSWGS